MKGITAVVLAAGKGERMKSHLPKVLHTIENKPLIGYVLQELCALTQVKQIIVVTGYQARLVEKTARVYAKNKKIDFARQKKLLGTADALKCALPKITCDNILVLCADAPLITRDTLRAFTAQHIEKKSLCSIITAFMESFNDLGKIMRDPLGTMQAIREKVDLETLPIHRTEQLREVNSGIYIFNRKHVLKDMTLIVKNPRKQEYFLTDLIEIFYDQGISIDTFVLKDNEEIFGINSQKDLSIASKMMRLRTLNSFIDQGIRIMDPETTFIAPQVKIGKNTLIFPFTFIENDVIIGDHCVLGPFLHIREGTRINDNSQLGNFVEVVRSKIGKSVRMKHHTYMGDTTVKDDVNIGAGTVIANYDGKRKNKTVIEKGAFIGSDSIVVAPVTIGENAVTGAGCVVTKNVARNSVVVGVPAKVLKKKR